MSAPQPVRPKAPLLIGLIGLIAVATIIVPVAALGLRVPWARISDYLGREEIRDMLLISVAAAFQSMLLALVMGLGLALWVQQLGRGSTIIRLLVYLPLAMPPVVGGLALTAALGRKGYLSPLLDALGIHLAFAFPGVVVAQTFVALPFVVVAVDSALRQLDQEILASARSVGLGRWEILGKITLPSIAPAVATGAALAFARSLGEFGTTLTFAGSQPGVTRTMPLGIYLEREVDADGAYVLSALLIGLALVCLAVAGLPALRRRRYQPQARRLHSLDVDKLRELTQPTNAQAVSVTVDGVRTALSPRAITAVVGPNGSGKSTLSYAIAGHPRYEITEGEVLLDGENLLDMDVDERARAGLFLAMQYPVEVPGVSMANFLRSAATAVRGEAPKIRDWVKEARAAMQELDIDPSFSERSVNEGFSGGEKKRHEVMQLDILKPKFAVMDETDSGLDVDALRIVSEGINSYQKETNGGILMITHYKRILNYVKPDFVHVFADGQVIKTGGAELADQLESDGYDQFLK